MSDIEIDDIDDLDNIVEQTAQHNLEDNDLERVEEGGFEENINEQEGPPGENEDDEESEKKAVKTKKVVRNPQPKLNPERLNGPRGLTALASYFDRVKYKGRGYEEQDLSVILKTYEYWCHRLFPKYSFDDCIAKIESLGTKKAVVTHIKKIRYDLISEDVPLSNDIVEDDDSSGAEDGPNIQFDDIFDAPHPQPSLELSEEQLEQIRLNKERAEKRRQENLRKKQGEFSQQEVPSFLASESEFPGEDEDFYQTTASQEVYVDKYLRSEMELLDEEDTLTQNSTQQRQLSESIAYSQIEPDEEQLKQIRLNKERAEKRRQENLRKKLQGSSQQVVQSSLASQSEFLDEDDFDQTVASQEVDQNFAQQKQVDETITSKIDLDKDLENENSHSQKSPKEWAELSPSQMESDYEIEISQFQKSASAEKRGELSSSQIESELVNGDKTQNFVSQQEQIGRTSPFLMETENISQNMFQQKSHNDEISQSSASQHEFSMPSRIETDENGSFVCQESNSRPKQSDKCEPSQIALQQGDVLSQFENSLPSQMATDGGSLQEKQPDQSIEDEITEKDEHIECSLASQIVVVDSQQDILSEKSADVK